MDYKDFMGYETSRALADLLNPLIGNTKQNKMLKIQNSHDIVSLFTNTPIKQTLDIIKKRLMDDKDIKKRTKLSVEDIVELLEFILTIMILNFAVAYTDNVLALPWAAQ